MYFYNQQILVPFGTLFINIWSFESHALFKRDSFLLKKYRIPNPHEVVENLKSNAREGALENL